jgi:hypothetical protein
MASTTTIALRTGAGKVKQYIPILEKVVVGHRATHNRDGLFLYVVAEGADGRYYETKSRGGGYRLAMQQGHARAHMTKRQKGER